MTTPYPGSRMHAVANAAEQAAPEAHAIQQAASDMESVQPDMSPVPVIETVAAHGNYFTVTIPASTAGSPSVRRLLPRDNERKIAYITPIDYPIVIATSLEQAQDPTNVGGTYPAGGYSSAAVTVTHCEAVYAANTSTAASCRVSVMVETGGPAT